MMVNRCEKIDFIIIYISDKRLSPFFISFILFLSIYSFLSFFLSFVILNLSYMSRTHCAFFFCLHVWVELSFLFWTFMSRTFLQVGGGVHMHPVYPPCVCACILSIQPIQLPNSVPEPISSCLFYMILVERSARFRSGGWTRSVNEILEGFA